MNDKNKYVSLADITKKTRSKNERIFCCGKRIFPKIEIKLNSKREINESSRHAIACHPTLGAVRKCSWGARRAFALMSFTPSHFIKMKFDLSVK